MILENLSLTSKKIKQFENKGIFTVEQLFRYIPVKYLDLRNETGFLPKDKISCIVGKVVKVKRLEDKHNTIMVYLKANTGENVLVTFFHQPYMYDIVIGMGKTNIFVCGNFEYSPIYCNYSCANPEVFESEVRWDNVRKITPIYSKIPGMANEFIIRTIKEAMFLFSLKEYLPKEILEKRQLFTIEEAIREIHMPTSLENIEKAYYRLLFDDLLYFSLKNNEINAKFKTTSKVEIKNNSIINKVKDNLSFSLTNDQEKALNEIVSIIKSKKRLNGLVQGDVGCGKSIVAFLSAIILAENNYQTVIMTPSKVLAKQHFEDLKDLLKDTDIKVILYSNVSKLRKKEKENLLSDIEDGKAKIIVGTTAMLSSEINYNNLGLLITDEEHKFGIVQKNNLIEKYSDCHLLSMSATPIPQTLAKTMMDDNMKLFEINELPKGKKKILNSVTNNLQHTFNFIYKELQEGMQIYVVCPAIEKNDKIKSVEEISAYYENAFCNYNVATLTGKTKVSESEKILNDFKDGKINILIATSVVEVGVNVPNANCIVIHDADFFGLASLHQLRGRVGRGKNQGYCIFFTEDIENERLNVIAHTTDGFEIAKADLKNRKMGDLIGTKQSGENKYVNEILKYPMIFDQAKEDAFTINDTDEIIEVLSQNDLIIE